jgi:hypothetical protein
MSGTFSGHGGDPPIFNQPLAAWDTSSVTDMHYMFHYAPAFDQPLGAWAWGLHSSTFQLNLSRF